MVKDRVQENGGLWIYEPMTEKVSSDRSVREVSSLALALDSNHEIAIFRDMHYCKLLSPFRALEVLYIDSQYTHGGYRSSSDLFLQ